MAAIHYELHKIIDLLDEEDAESIFKILKKIVQNYNDDDLILTSDEIKRMEVGEGQIAEGQYVTLQEYKEQGGI